MSEVMRMALDMLWQGMAGIFAVIGVIALIVLLLAKSDKQKQ